MKKYIITTIAAIFAAFTTLEAGTASKTGTPAGVRSTGGDGVLAGSLDVSYVGNYTFRGQVLDTNPVVVPKLSLSAPLTDGIKLVGSIEQVLGTRGSTLFRSQYNVGVEVQVGRLTVTPGYEIFSFPNAAGVPDTQVATLRFNLDDTGLVLPFNLNPYVDLGKGVSGVNSGTRGEVGVNPRLLTGKLDVSLPVAAGWSYNSYYPGYPQSAKYAYTTVGLAGEYHVTNRFSVKGLVAAYNTDSKLGNKSNNFITTNVGVAVSF
jgi:hypothetical protein